MFRTPLHATFYIFRHGDTYQTKNKLPYEDEIVSAPIIREATDYLVRIGNYLVLRRVEYAVTSAFIRCLQSAQIVGKKMGLTFSIDDRLNEYDPVYLPGELEEHFQNRIQSFLSEIQDKNFSSVAICAHGSGISFIKHELTSAASSWNSLDYPAPGMLLTIKDGKTSLKDFRNNT